MRSLVLAVAMLAGSVMAVAPVSASAAATADVTLRLEVAATAWEAGAAPKLSLRFYNRGSRPVRVVAPLDGSWDGMRSPHYTLELLDETGAVVPDALGVPGGRCGLSNPLHPAQDIAELHPGAVIDAHHSPNSFAWHGVVGEDARPGRYRARVRYRSTTPGATALTLVSNAVDVTITGGNLSTWTCMRDQARLASRYDTTTVEPLAVGRLGDADAVLIRRVDVQVRGDERQRTGELSLQLLDDAGPRGAPVVLARTRGLALAGMVEVDGGLTVVYTVDGRGPTGGGPQSLQAVTVERRGDALVAGTPATWTRKLASAYTLAVARAGDERGALYFEHRGENDAALIYQPLRADGRPLAPTVQLDHGPVGSDLGLTPGKDGLWATWSRGRDTVIRSLGAGGRPAAPPIVIAGPLGTFAALRVDATGFTIAYEKDFTHGQIPGDKMGLMLQRFDAAGVRVGRPVALTPGEQDDPQRGGVAWGPTAAARAHAGRHDHDSLAPADLLFGPIGAPATMVARTLLGEPVIAAAGERFVVAWSDSRDDAAKVCTRVGACVGEVYAATYAADGRPLLAPARLTRAAVSGQVAAEWRRIELCR